MEVSQKLKTETPYDPVIPHLGMYLKKMKIFIWNDIYTSVFIANLFTIAKVWKQPTCLSTGEWIRRCGVYAHTHTHTHTHTLECYFGHIKNENFHLQQRRWTWRALCWVICQTKTNTVWYHLYFESEKYSKLVNETKKEADSQVQRMNQWLPVGRREVRGTI